MPKIKVMYDKFFTRVPYGGHTCMWVTPSARIPVLALAMCEDGQLRAVRLNQQADTFFSHPGRATILGKTRRGYVTQKDNQLRFILYNESIQKLREDSRVNNQEWFKNRCQSIDSHPGFATANG